MCRTAEWQRVRDFIEDARDAGHEITVDWTGAVEALNGASEGDLSPADAWRHAEADLRAGVKMAEMCVFLADEGGYCGALIEYGAALAWHIPVLLVAPWRPSIFWHAPTTTILPDETAVRDMLGMRLREVV